MGITIPSVRAKKRDDQAGLVDVWMQQNASNKG